jgi:hypothetical protein
MKQEIKKSVSLMVNMDKGSSPTREPKTTPQKVRSNSINLGKKPPKRAAQVDTYQLILKRNLKQSIKTTYMLLIVSKWFILLHLPYFVCWCFYYLHLNSLVLHSFGEASVEDFNKKLLLKSFLQMFEILFLFNYSINFLLYMLYGPLFRKTHTRLMFKMVQNIVYYMSYCFYRCFKLRS